MSFPAELALNAVFDRLGVAAVLDPDGAARAVRVLPDREDDIQQIGSLQTLHATSLFEIRAKDFGGSAKGAVLEVGGERFEVQSFRHVDARKLKILLDTVPADA